MNPLHFPGLPLSGELSRTPPDPLVVLLKFVRNHTSRANPRFINNGHKTVMIKYVLWNRSEFQNGVTGKPGYGGALLEMVMCLSFCRFCSLAC